MENNSQAGQCYYKKLISCLVNLICCQNKMELTIGTDGTKSWYKKNWYKWYKKLVQKTGTNGTKKLMSCFNMSLMESKVCVFGDILPFW